MKKLVAIVGELLSQAGIVRSLTLGQAFDRISRTPLARVDRRRRLDLDSRHWAVLADVGIIVLPLVKRMMDGSHRFDRSIDSILSLVPLCMLLPLPDPDAARIMVYGEAVSPSVYRVMIISSFESLGLAVVVFGMSSYETVQAMETGALPLKRSSDAVITLRRLSRA